MGKSRAARACGGRRASARWSDKRTAASRPTDAHPRPPPRPPHTVPPTTACIDKIPTVKQTRCFKLNHLEIRQTICSCDDIPWTLAGNVHTSASDARAGHMLSASSLSGSPHFTSHFQKATVCTNLQPPTSIASLLYRGPRHQWPERALAADNLSSGTRTSWR